MNVLCDSLDYGTLHTPCLGGIGKSSCSILQKLKINDNGCALPGKASGLILIPDIPGARGRRHAGMKPPVCCSKG